MTDKSKAKAIVLLEKLRLVDSEVFRLSTKYGVNTIDDLDKLITSGNLSEEKIGEDFFRFDHLISQKRELEKELKSLSINKSLAWKSLQDLLKLPKSSFLTS